MHTPLWIKLGMAAGFSFLGLYSINMIGDMPGNSSGGHGEETHIVSTEEAGTDGAAAGHGDTAGHGENAGHGETVVVDAGHEATETTETTGAATDGTEEAVEVVVLVGDADAGKKLAKKKCGTCHTFDDGGKNRVGPNLFAVVDSPKASKEGFRYSGAMTSAGGTWNEADLTAFVTNPKGFIKGTKMTFKGLRKDTEQANMIAYLKSLK